MPITYRIDRDQRLVAARAHGVLTAQDLFAYQNDVWSRPEVMGYSELMDMTDAQEVVDPSAEGIQALAELSARMDHPSAGGAFAIVAPQDLAFGLGRMYQAYREAGGNEAKPVGVFRTMDEALRWLAGRASESGEGPLS